MVLKKNPEGWIVLESLASAQARTTKMKAREDIPRVYLAVSAMVFLLSVGGNPLDKGTGRAKLEPRSGDIDLSKPGTCPLEPVVSASSLSACALDCIFDLECPGTERCCPDHCGGTACIETTENAAVDRPEITASTAGTTEAPTSPQTTRNQATQTQTTVPATGRTVAATTPLDRNGDSDLYLQGQAVVNVTVVAGRDLVLHCQLATSSEEPLVIFWMVQRDVGFLPWSDLPHADNKRVSNGGSRLEFNGVRAGDARRFVCLGGHSRGYLTQTYVVTVTAEPGTDLDNLVVGCSSHDCLNNGTCAESGNQTFYCVCTDGYQGEDCGVTSDPCQRQPDVCRNGATCVPGGAGGEELSCACAEGWAGARCESRPPAGGAAACLNGSTCEGEVLATTQASGAEGGAMSDACYLPLDGGRCSRKENKWYYDAAAQLCRPFVYNGCRGNANRFRSYDECQWECPELPPDPCTHPIAKGRCKALIPRWAYSPEAKKCVEFVYGGCGPTGNNFPTEEECAQTCMPEVQRPCEPCGATSLARAYCDSDFVITGIVRRQLLSDGQLKTVVLELTRRYKGHGLALRRSRFLDEPLVVARSRSPQESSGCTAGRCFEDLQDGKEYILTGTLSREGAGQSVALLTNSSYIKPAVGRRLVKLQLIFSDRAFNGRCSRRLETPL